MARNRLKMIWGLILSSLFHEKKSCNILTVPTLFLGLDKGDMAAIDTRFKSTDAPCQLDSEDGRYFLT